MSDQFVAEIRIFPYTFAPVGWAFCNGQLLAISQNTALFSLIGTIYGGNGTSTFALPDLRGAVALHAGNGPGLTPRAIGETGGTETVTLLQAEMPAHAHDVETDSSALDTSLASPSGAVLGNPSPKLIYSSVQKTATVMNPAMIAPTGGSQPHSNVMPYLVFNHCIALQGIFPARS